MVYLVVSVGFVRYGLSGFTGLVVRFWCDLLFWLADWC